MGKFWTGVFLLGLTGIVLLAMEAQAAGINFTNLETECRYDQGQNVNINLQNDRLNFNGQFFVNNPNADLSYNYRQDGRIVLNVRASPTEEPSPFADDCRGLAVYSAHTSPLNPGIYTVIVRHNGKEAERQVISIK